MSYGLQRLPALVHTLAGVQQFPRWRTTGVWSPGSQGLQVKASIMYCPHHPAPPGGAPESAVEKPFWVNMALKMVSADIVRSGLRLPLLPLGTGLQTDPACGPANLWMGPNLQIPAILHVLLYKESSQQEHGVLISVHYPAPQSAQRLSGHTAPVLQNSLASASTSCNF